MTKTVNKEELKNALSKYYNDHYKDRFNDIDRGILAKRFTSVVFSSLSLKGYSLLHFSNDTLITKIKEDCYKTEGKFAEDYLK